MREGLVVVVNDIADGVEVSKVYRDMNMNGRGQEVFDSLKENGNINSLNLEVERELEDSEKGEMLGEFRIPATVDYIYILNNEETNLVYEDTEGNHWYLPAGEIGIFWRGNRARIRVNGLLTKEEYENMMEGAERKKKEDLRREVKQQIVELFKVLKEIDSSRSPYLQYRTYKIVK